jgi:6-phosphogluconolactonase (cycloisomerase 2 family)
VKNFVSTLSLFVLGLCINVFLSGCGSVSATSPSPTPTPVSSGPTPTPTPGTPTPTPTPAAAHGTFVYSSNSSGQTVGYKLNADGSLTALAGSPFAVDGTLAAAGSFLVAESSNSISTYQVDASSGALTQAGTGATGTSGRGVFGLAGDSKNVYVSAVIPSNALTGTTGVYGFAMDANGTLTPLPGSPYVFQSCDFCDSPITMALNNNFLVVGGAGMQALGDISTYTRADTGVLSFAQFLGANGEQAVTMQHPVGHFAYALDFNNGIAEFSIEKTGTPTLGTVQFLFSTSDLTVDATGKFLLAVDDTGVVHVFSINPTSGAFSQIGTSEAAGNGTLGITMDPSGRFVILTQSTLNAPLGTVNQITVFTFDPTTGGMKKLQSYPQAAMPGKATIIAK